jgi:hypothetical protein
MAAACSFRSHHDEFCPQEDRLLISDPKALQYIYHVSGYNFPKQSERREISRLLAGCGILWAEGKSLTILGFKFERIFVLPR